MRRMAVIHARRRHWVTAGVIALVLAGCKQSEPAPDPSATPSEESRSIFDQESTGGQQDASVPAELPPLEITISFADGTSELTEAALAELANVLKSQQVIEGGLVTLGGHSNSGGSDAANLRASENRADAVRSFLVKNGIAEDRITVIAFGEQNPIEPNALPNGEPNEEGRAANRRVELRVETGKPATGEDTDRKETLIETLAKPEPGEETSTAKSSPAPAQ